MLGRLHVVLVHLPLGLLAGVVLLRLLSAWYGERYRTALPALMWLCALGGLAAAAAGWILFLGEGNQWGALGSWHQWLGTALALSLIATAWAMQRIPRSGSWARIASDAGIISCAVLAGITGHYGGQMTHGRNYLFGGSSSQPAAADPSPDRQARTPALAPIVIHNDADDNGNDADDEHDQADEDTATELDHQALWRAAETVIINHCVECHNSDRARGHLNLERYDLIMRGGGSGPAVRPGEPERSPLLNLAELPEDNWDRMPPEGPPLNNEELDALRQWIVHGAPGPDNDQAADDESDENGGENDDPQS